MLDNEVLDSLHLDGWRDNGRPNFNGSGREVVYAGFVEVRPCENGAVVDDAQTENLQIPVDVVVKLAENGYEDGVSFSWTDGQPELPEGMKLDTLEGQIRDELIEGSYESASIADGSPVSLNDLADDARNKYVEYTAAALTECPDETLVKWWNQYTDNEFEHEKNIQRNTEHTAKVLQALSIGPEYDSQDRYVRFDENDLGNRTAVTSDRALNLVTEAEIKALAGALIESPEEYLSEDQSLASLQALCPTYDRDQAMWPKPEYFNACIYPKSVHQDKAVTVTGEPKKISDENLLDTLTSVLSLSKADVTFAYDAIDQYGLNKGQVAEEFRDLLRQNPSEQPMAKVLMTAVGNVCRNTANEELYKTFGADALDAFEMTGTDGASFYLTMDKHAEAAVTQRLIENPSLQHPLSVCAQHLLDETLDWEKIDAARREKTEALTVRQGRSL